ILEREEASVVDLLSHFADRVFERNVVARSQRPHTRSEACSLNPCLQCLQVFWCSFRSDERLFSGATEQAHAHGFETRLFDPFQALIEGPFRPRSVEAADMPIDTFGFRLDGTQNVRCNTCNDGLLDE